MPMKKSSASTLILVISALVGILYFTYMPSASYTRNAQRLLDDIEKGVKTHNSASIGPMMHFIFDDDAKITLQVYMPPVPGQKGQMFMQNFDKIGFLSYTNRLLAVLQDYAFTGHVDSLTLNSGRKSGTMNFTAKVETNNLRTNNLAARFHYTGVATCTAELTFVDPQQPPHFHSLTCELHLSGGMVR